MPSTRSPSPSPHTRRARPERGHWLAALTLTALASLQAPAARAQQAQPQAEAKPSADRAKREASKRFRNGVALYREGAFRAALIEFKRAYELKPNYRLLYNMGQTHFELGEYLEASETLRRYLEEGGKNVSPARRREVEDKLMRLRDRIALISVTVNRDGAEIFIDDKKVGESPLARGVAVNLGRHRVSARGADGAVAATVVEVGGGDIKKVELALADKPEPAPVASAPAPEPPPRSLKRKLALWGLGATAALAAGTGLAIALQRAAFSDFEGEADRRGADPNVVAANHARASRRAKVADALGALTLVAGGASLVAWLLDRRDESSRPAPVEVELGATSVVIRGEF